MSADTIIAPVMTILGLVVCFGSTYFKKICSALTGFVWGTLVAAISQLISGGLFDVSEDFILISLGVGVVCAIVLYMFDSLAGAINAFFIVTLFALLFGIVYWESYFESFEGLGAFAVVAGLIAGGIAFAFDKYAFAITTAVAGATFSGLGGTCLIHSVSLSDAMGSIFYGSSDIFSSLPVIIIVLGGLGAAFQLYGLSVIQKKTGEGKINYTHITQQAMTFINRNVLVSVVPVLAAFIPVLFELILNLVDGGISGSATPWITLTAQSIVLGSIVFLVSNEKLKAGIVLGALYNAFYIITHFKNYFVNEYGWSIDWGTFRAIETAIILAVLAKLISQEKIKLAALPAIAYFTFHYFMSYISVRDIFAVNFNGYEFWGFITVYITVMALYYKYKGVVIYKDKTSIIVLLVVLTLIGGTFILQKVAVKMDEKEAKGGWQNYEEEKSQFKNEGWTIIKNESKYSDLIAGALTSEQLYNALALFRDPTDSEDIDLFFEDSYWPTFMICDRPEQITDEENPGYAHYVYDIDEVNNKISGLTNFQYQANEWYDDVRYTDEDNMHIIIPATGWDNDMYVKNIRGRYNQEELIVDYDWYSFSYDSGESEDWYEYSLSAIFRKNGSGKFQLDKITLGEQEADNTEENDEQLMSDEQQAVFDETIFQCLRGQDNESQTLIKFHLDGSFDEYFFRSAELIESAGTWTYDVDSEMLTIIDYARAGEEELFVKDGEAFRSEEVMGDDYHWLSPDRMGREDLFY